MKVIAEDYVGKYFKYANELERRYVKVTGIDDNMLLCTFIEIVPSYSHTSITINNWYHYYEGQLKRNFEEIEEKEFNNAMDVAMTIVTNGTKN